MRVRILIAGLALFASSTSTAQSGPTGTWVGVLESGDRQTSARVVLQATGGTVTGLITGSGLIPGDVRGSFTPGTGALALTVSLQGTDAQIEFAGGIAGDSLTVRAQDDGQTFVLRAARTSDAAMAPPLAPVTPLDTAAAAVRRSFTEVRGWLLDAAALVPPERYGYRPVASVRTVGQLVAHMADGFRYYCGRGNGSDVEWSEAAEQGGTDKTGALAALREALRLCDTAYANPRHIGPLVENVAHTSLHYGNLVTYIRMLGLVPPSS